MRLFDEPRQLHLNRLTRFIVLFLNHADQDLGIASHLVQLTIREPPPMSSDGARISGHDS